MARETHDKYVNTDESYFKTKTVFEPAAASRHVFMFGNKNIAYTIKVDRSFLDAIKCDGGTLTVSNEDQPLLRLSWKNTEEESRAIFTKWRLDFKTIFKGMRKSIFREIAKDVFDPFREKVIEEIFRRYEAELVALLPGSLVFVFQHSSKHAAEDMMAQESDVANLFKHFFSDIMNKDINIRLRHTFHRGVNPLLMEDTQPKESSNETRRGDTFELDIEDTRGTRIWRELKEIRETVTNMRDTFINFMSESTNTQSHSHSEKETPILQESRTKQQLEQLIPQVVVSYRAEYGQGDIDCSDTTTHKDLGTSQSGERASLKDQQHDSAKLYGHSQAASCLETHKYDSRRSDAPELYEETHSWNTSKSTLSTVETHMFHDEDPSRVYVDEGDSDHREESDLEKEQRRIAGAIENNYVRAEIMLRNLHVCSIGQADRDPRVQRLANCVAIALEKEFPPPSKAYGQDTVLCIDVSESLGKKGFEAVKETAHIFVDGIEDMAEKYALEENISVVVMGGGAKMYQQLTNDYGAVRDAIDRANFGGRSPVFEALVICIAAIKEKASTLVLNGVHHVHPRVIFLTDGFITSDKVVDGPDLTTMDRDGRFDVIRLIKSIRDEERHIDPITWVAVGDRPETMSLLEALAKLGSGQVLPSTDIKRLCKHYNIQSNIGKIYCYLKTQHEGWDGNMEIVESVTSALVGDMDASEKEAVLDGIKKKRDETAIPPNPDRTPDEFDNVYEVSEILPLGTRVIRGPDWQYGDQDLDGPGTVINHSNDKGKLWVHWDLNSCNCRYRYGCDEKMDIIEVEDQPRFLREDELMEIGIRVKRGPDWSFGDQDGGRGNTGVVIRTRPDAVVKVKWQTTGEIYAYKYGMDGRIDLAVCDPCEFMKQLTAKLSRDTPINSNTEAVGEDETQQTREKPNIIWQWKDDQGRWRLYAKDLRKKLEKEFKRKSTGSCLLRKGHDSVRVIFRQPMSERSVGEGPRHEVQRIAVSDSDLKEIEDRERAFHYS